MENKNIIIILVAIILVLATVLGVMFFQSTNAKDPTKIKITSNKTLTEGDSLKVKLTDVNGTEITNQTVNVTITGKDGSGDYHSVVTNENGIGKLKLDKSAGKYNVTVSYAGNDKYNWCNASKKITIEEEVVEQVQSTSSESTQTPRYTTDEHGTYDNVRDMYIDRQAAGLSKSELQYYDDLERRNGGRAD